MNGRAEMLFARSVLGCLGIKLELATRGTPKKHSHCIRTLIGKMSVSVRVDFLHLHLNCMLDHYGFFPALNSPATITIPVWRGQRESKLSCPMQEQNTMTRSSALAMRPARLLSNTTRQTLGTDGCLICYTTSVELSKTVRLKITKYKACNSNPKKPEINNTKKRLKRRLNTTYFWASSGFIQHRRQINKKKAIKKSNFQKSFAHTNCEAHVVSKIT